MRELSIDAVCRHHFGVCIGLEEEKIVNQLFIDILIVPVETKERTSGRAWK